jgi:large subunit ribosomal protein L36
MKVVSSLQKRCAACRFVRRGKKVYIKCDRSPRHKQRQGFSTLAPATPELASIQFNDWLADLLAFEMLLIRPFVLPTELRQ